MPEKPTGASPPPSPAESQEVQSDWKRTPSREDARLHSGVHSASPVQDDPEAVELRLASYFALAFKNS
jgi:hypothetical protein